MLDRQGLQLCIALRELQEFGRDLLSSPIERGIDAVEIEVSGPSLGEIELREEYQGNSYGYLKTVSLGFGEATDDDLARNVVSQRQARSHSLEANEGKDGYREQTGSRLTVLH